MQQYKDFVASLECLVEGLRERSRGIGIGRVDVNQIYSCRFDLLSAAGRYVESPL